MLIPPVTEKDHIRGLPGAPITLVEYGDFQDPHCGKAYSFLKEILEGMDSKVRLVYRHFPVIENHQYAEMAAEASEAANAQMKFWEMHDMLFEHQNALEEQYIIRYAKELGLDLPRFKEDMKTHNYKKLVDEDAVSGEESGVEHTPEFFLNGEIYEGPNTKDSLQAVILHASGVT